MSDDQIEGVKVELTEQELQKLAATKKQERRIAFTDEYVELCKKHGFEMHPLVQITPAGIQTMVEPVETKK